MDDGGNFISEPMVYVPLEFLHSPNEIRKTNFDRSWRDSLLNILMNIVLKFEEIQRRYGRVRDPEVVVPKLLIM